MLIETNPKANGTGRSANGDQAAFLQVRSVSKSYGSHTVLQSLSIDIQQGEFLTILGESGSGKTTLLRIIAGFEEASSGEVLLEGTQLLRLSPARRPINTVFQSYALFPHLTVFENIAYGLRVRRRPRAEVNDRVDDAMRMVRMETFATHFPGQISGGQKQRVSLARALVNQPKMLLLDEPLSALDANLRVEMQKELKLLQQQLGITFLFVTHDQEEAMSLSDRIVLLHRGSIEQCGSPLEIYLQPRTAYAASFIGRSNLIRGTVQSGVAQCGPFRLAVGGPDGPVTLSLRPESIRAWTESEPPAGHRFRAVVEVQQFQGASVLLSLRCVDGTALTARVTTPIAPCVGQTHEFACYAQDFVRLDQDK